MTRQHAIPAREKPRELENTLGRQMNRGSLLSDISIPEPNKLALVTQTLLMAISLHALATLVFVNFCFSSLF